mmetsp:Transcript_28277/g.91170  ORF Transcript_28277/g.91170 Transcript_28277/m.91170 type:complete len:236 (+) Transcript_28277:1161-1868(+)
MHEFAELRIVLGRDVRRRGLGFDVLVEEDGDGEGAEGEVPADVEHEEAAGDDAEEGEAPVVVAKRGPKGHGPLVGEVGAGPVDDRVARQEPQGDEGSDGVQVLQGDGAATEEGAQDKSAPWIFLLLLLSPVVFWLCCCLASSSSSLGGRSCRRRRRQGGEHRDEVIFGDGGEEPGGAGEGLEAGAEGRYEDAHLHDLRKGPARGDDEGGAVVVAEAIVAVASSASPGGSGDEDDL